MSRHLRVLRDSGFVAVRADGTRRLYAVGSAPPQEVDIRLERFRRFWSRHLDTLGAELARGGRGPRKRREDDAGTPPAERHPSTRNEEDT